MRRRSFITSSALLPLAGPLSVHADNKSAARRPRAGYFPNVVLTTHEGKAVRFYDDLVQGKVVMFNFMYAACDGICPGTTANLLRVQESLGDRVGRDIFMYSITLKPDEDTPQVLKEYAEMHGVKPGWLFLTGKPGDIEFLRRRLGYYDPDPLFDRDNEQHIGIVRFGNERLDRWAAHPGMSNPEQIARAILLIANVKSA